MCSDRYRLYWPGECDGTAERFEYEAELYVISHTPQQLRDSWGKSTGERHLDSGNRYFLCTGSCIGLYGCHSIHWRRKRGHRYVEVLSGCQHENYSGSCADDVCIFYRAGRLDRLYRECRSGCHPFSNCSGRKKGQWSGSICDFPDSVMALWNRNGSSAGTV